MKTEIGVWTTSPLDASLTNAGWLNDQSVPVNHVSARVIVRPTASGKGVRAVLSNEYGEEPLVISSLTVSKSLPRRGGRGIRKATMKQMTYLADEEIVIPPGEAILTDMVPFSFRALDHLAFTMYIKQMSNVRTIGLYGGQSFLAAGNRTNHFKAFPRLPSMEYEGDTGKYAVVPILKTVNAVNSDAKESILVIGDSTVTNDVPLKLAKKLRSKGYKLAVVQQAIKGNRMLTDGQITDSKVGRLLGESVQHRFERDVLTIEGVKTVLLKIGMNDILHPHCESLNGSVPVKSADDLIRGFTDLITLAHKNGMEIYLLPLTPWKGYTRNVLGSGDDIAWTEELDAVRKKVNSWMFSDLCPADGAIDLSALAKGDDPDCLIDDYTPDGIHFTDEGQEVMSEIIYHYLKQNVL